jgi:hypothetical protein
MGLSSTLGAKIPDHAYLMSGPDQNARTGGELRFINQRQITITSLRHYPDYLFVLVVVNKPMHFNVLIFLQSYALAQRPDHTGINGVEATPCN